MVYEGVAEFCAHPVITAVNTNSNSSNNLCFMFGIVLVFSLLDEVSFNFLQIRGKSRWFLYGYEIFGVKNRKRRDKKDYTKRETDF